MEDRVFMLVPRLEYRRESDLTIEELNEIGQEGWELAGYAAASDSPVRVFYVFKRPIYDAPEGKQVEESDGQLSYLNNTPIGHLIAEVDRLDMEDFAKSFPGNRATFTMVENKYPDMKPTSFTWQPATESPGKRRVLMALTRKDLKEGQYVFESVWFLSAGVRPAECTFRDSEGRKQLPVAWTYYDEITKGIEPWMISRAESAAWAWWPDKEDDNNKE